MYDEIQTKNINTQVILKTTNNLNMSSMMTTINLKATIAACTEFGSRIGEKLNSREGDAFDIAFKEAIAELSTKPLSKKPKSSSPKKTSLQSWLPLPSLPSRFKN